jgi:DNA-binding NtrC family response regulator
MTRNGQRLLLLIDDEPAQRRLVSVLAARAGWRSIFASDGEMGVATLGTPDGMQLDAILLDHSAPGTDSCAIIAALRERRPALPILMLTADGSVAQAVAAMRAGATDFLVKPLAPERLLAALEAAVAGTAAGELRPLTEKIPALLAFDEIVGSAPEFRAALAVAAKAARARVPLLIEGESGVGKEVVAEAIHAASPRGKKPMVCVNCGAIPANLVESELFGHEKGAFTGAFERKIGKFADADGGTIFLDEVSEMPLDSQVKLLRALQTGEIHPIGARHGREVDVRVIAATNRRLADEVEAGRFREDLYDRLNVVPVQIPPLRERSGDIPALARHLLQRIARQPGLRSLGITDDALQLLSEYDWPGNVRQLQNALFRAAVLCDGAALTRADFPQIASLGARRDATTQAAMAGGVTLFHPDGNMRPLEDIEADVIRLAIGHYRGRMTEVARRLGIGRSTLYRKLGELGIESAACPQRRCGQDGHARRAASADPPDGGFAVVGPPPSRGVAARHLPRFAGEDQSAAIHLGSSARLPNSRKRGWSGASPASCAQPPGCGMKAAQAPAASAGSTSERIESPAMSARSGATSWRAKRRRKVSGVLSLTISTPSNRSPRPDAASFASWCSRSPLVTSTSRAWPARRSSVSSTPSSSSTGCASSRRPAARMSRTADTGSASPPSSSAVSIIDRVKLFAP